MDEQTILAELVPAVNSLKTLALVALDMEEAHPWRCRNLLSRTKSPRTNAT